MDPASKSAGAGAGSAAEPGQSGHHLSLATAAHIVTTLHESAERSRHQVDERKRRAEFAFISSVAEKWIWVTDPEQCYVPAKVVKELPDGGMEVEVGSAASVRTCKKAELGQYILRIADLKSSFEDMVRMTDVNEATILHNLRMRFQEDKIYTNIGTILVSINPFKRIEGLYSSDLVQLHFHTPVGEVADPHVFQIAAAAYHGLRSERLDQSIIISGESGAGKTEATKQCLQFLAEAAGSSAAGMADKLLSANPILEAFGNAKTVRNNNSSRFGKWMEVHFNGRAQICGSQIINYLLEKSRVVFQAGGERNYHIFYQLCAAAPADMRAKYSIGHAEDYGYTNRSSIVVEGLDDKEEFKDLMHAFGQVEISMDEWEPMFQIVAGLLHLSNVVFEPIDADSCRLSGNPFVASELRHAARLLGVEAEPMQLALEQKLIETRNERVRSPLSVEKAADARNSMAKALYGRMFDWLVQRVNSAMEGSLAASTNVIGVLDIFGFEIFEINSFEQLCINYCNEKLQQHFNYHVFKAEERCYKAEEIDYAEVVFVDNQDVLDLIEKRPDGLLPKLDDECRVPRGSDQGYLEKIQKTHADNPRFKARVRRGHEPRDFEFGVFHYAGVVHYDVRNFSEKNKDELLLNIRELLNSSTLPFIHRIFTEESAGAARQAAAAAAASGLPNSPAPMQREQSTGGAAAGKGGSDKQSQAFQFRGQLDALMKTLNATEPHYIRCVKPNSVKKGNIFDAPICLQQLRYAGVFEAVKIRQQGFPFRWTYDTFYKRYRGGAGADSFRALIPKDGFNWREGCRKLLEDLAISAPAELSPVAKLFKFGKTMVLYRADQHRVLEMIRDHVRDSSARVAQRVYRAHAVRKKVKVLKAALVRVRAATVARNLELVQAALAEGNALWFPLFELKALRVLEARLLEEKACLEGLQTLFPLDPADHYAQYEAVLKEARRLELTDPLVAACQNKFATVKDRIETKARLQRGIAIGDRALILASLAKAEELKKDWGDIVNVEQLQAAQEMLRVIALEETTQEELRQALLSGGAAGPIGALDASTVDVSRLEAVLAECRSGRVRINTTLGHNLIASCSAIRDLRVAQRTGNWKAVQVAVDALVKLRAEDKLVEQAEPETRKAEAEIADKRIQDELLTALSNGAVKGRTGELNLKSADVAGLTDAIGRTKAAAEHVGGLSPPAEHLLHCAELILKLRQAMVASDWTGIKKVVHDGLEMRLPEVCLPEVITAKDELDNHSIIHQLTDALEKGHAIGTVSRLDTSTIDTGLLTERIAHAEEIGPKTVHAHALIKLARIIRRIRELLQARDYAPLLEMVAQASGIPREYIPNHVADELLIAQFEGENVTIVRTLNEALRTGGAAGQVGAVNRGECNVTVLQLALRKVNTYRCRSLEALWLYEVTEALADLREGFRLGHWHALQELIGGVRGLHGTRPSGHLAECPVLKTDRHPPRTQRMSSVAAGLGAGVSPTSAASSGGLGAPLDSARSRSTSTEVRAGAGGAAAATTPSSAAAAAAAGRMGAVSPPVGSPEERSRASIALRAGAGSRGVSDGRLSGRRSSIVGSALGGLTGHMGSHLEAVEEEFNLPAEVLAELQVVQDELDNYNTVTNLTRTLSSGGPTGELGLLDASGVDIDQLSIALKKAARVGCKTPLSASLTYTGQVVRDLRQSLRDGQWASVESTLKYVASNNARVARMLGRMPVIVSGGVAASLSPGSALPPAGIPARDLGVIELPASTAEPVLLDQAAIVLSPPGLQEVIRVEAESQYKKVMDVMAGALSAGAGTGEVGKLDVSGCDVEGLAAAIDASRALNSRTPKSRHLTALCRLMWQMRTAVREEDYVAVESLLVAGAEVLGKSASNPLPAGCEVPPAVVAETDLYRAEAHNRRIIESLRLALMSKQASGEVGHLQMNDVDVKPLETAVQMALQLGVRTPEARCLVATATHMRSMRLALIGQSWERLGELLDYVSTAEAKGKSYTFSSASPATVTTGTGAAASAPGGAVSTNTKDGVGSMGFWAGVVDASTGYDLVADGVAGESKQEAHLMQLELNNRNVIVELTKALNEGAAEGGIGHLDVSTIRMGPLDWAIDYAIRLGCVTREAEQLLATAQVVRRIRLALGHGNWQQLEEALASARGKVLAEVGAKEIQAAQDELDNRRILADLTAALARGKPQGRTGRLYTGSIDLKPLNDAIALAQQLTPKTTEARQMLFTSKVVARLRMCLLNEDIAEAGVTLEAVRGKLLASVSMPEIRLVQDEVDNWTVITDLTSALSRGGVSGTPGALDLSALDTTALEAALNRADELGVKTSEATSLYTAAAQIYKLRSAVLRDAWTPPVPGGEDPECVDAILRESATMPLSDIAHAEMGLLQQELDNRRVITTLSLALSRSGAKGPVGDLQLVDVDTTELDAAIAGATQLTARTEDAERLLQAAKLIRRLRSVMLAGNWQWVGSVLLEARAAKHLFPQVSLKELQLAQDELDNRAIIAQMTASLRTGAPSGSIGRVDPDSIDVSGIDEALTYAHTLGIKSVEASGLVATAQVIRALRIALKMGDMPAAVEQVEAVKSRSLASVAADELQLAKLTVENWRTITDLTTAVATGQAVGPLGDVDVKAIAVDALDAAIAATGKSGVHTVEARRALVTAVIIRRLRAAFLSLDYAFLAQVVAEAQAENDALLPACRTELQLAKDTLEFRAVLEVLRQATDTQDEARLTDALGRAAKLDLANHSRASVREIVETASLTLSRLQRCKASLSGAVRSMDTRALLDGLAMAGGIGFAHPLVDEAKSVLSKVQDLSNRAAEALKAMDALAMQSAARECDALGLALPVVADIRRTLALPRAEFLKRELDSVLTAISTGTGVGAIPEADPVAAAVAAGNPAAAHGPTATELRVINCTLQVKDLFFADAPDADDAIAAAVVSSALSVPGTPGASAAASAASGNRLSTFLATNPTAASAVAAMRTQRYTDENIRGAQARVSMASLLSASQQPLSLWSSAPSSVFKPAGYARQPGQPMPVGGAVPPAHSPLRRQFSLDRFNKLKPAHMFSQRFTASTSIAESGMLRWQHEPLHTSLTLLQSPESRRMAVMCFRNILAFMGDRPLSRPVGLAQEVVSMGLTHPDLRDEILLQLAKQLSNNPSIASAERGWVLMYLCLSTFPPGEDLENHLELWLREQGAVPCVWALHLALYRSGPGPAGLPTLTDIGMALERARAPALPSFILESDSAAALAEYASMPKIGPAAAAALADTPSLPSLADKLEAAKPSTASAPTPAALVGAARDEFERLNMEDHAYQLAFMRNLGAAEAGGASASSVRRPSAASAAVTAAASSTGAGKRVTPTKPGAEAAEAKATSLLSDPYIQQILAARPVLSSSINSISGAATPAPAPAPSSGPAAVGAAAALATTSLVSPAIPPLPPAVPAPKVSISGTRPQTPTKPGSSLSAATVPPSALPPSALSAASLTAAASAAGKLSAASAMTLSGPSAASLLGVADDDAGAAVEAKLAAITEALSQF